MSVHFPPLSALREPLHSLGMRLDHRAQRPPLSTALGETADVRRLLERLLPGQRVTAASVRGFLAGLARIAPEIGTPIRERALAQWPLSSPDAFDTDEESVALQRTLALTDEYPSSQEQDALKQASHQIQRIQGALRRMQGPEIRQARAALEIIDGCRALYALETRSSDGLARRRFLSPAEANLIEGLVQGLGQKGAIKNIVADVALNKRPLLTLPVFPRHAMAQWARAPHMRMLQALTLQTTLKQVLRATALEYQMGGAPREADAMRAAVTQLADLAKRHAGGAEGCFALMGQVLRTVPVVHDDHARMLERIAFFMESPDWAPPSALASVH